MAIEYPDAVSALYRSAHESFVPERKRLAAELKAAGDKAGAARLARLVRPPLSAWAVNQLWWNARESFEQLFEGSGRLRRGDRTAAIAHRDALVALRSRAAQLLADSGHSATDATLRRVATTLSALAAAGSFAPDPPGALAADRDPPGFDTLGDGAAADGPATAADGPATAPGTPASLETAPSGGAVREPAHERAAANDTAADADADAAASAVVEADAEAERQRLAAQAERQRVAEADAERQRLAREEQARADAERQLAEERARLERERVRREDQARVAGSLRAARQEIDLCAREVARLEHELRAAERRSERTRATVAELEAQLARLEAD